MSKEELLKYLIAEIDLIMHDKDYRFENEDGTWYSRESCRDLTNEEVFKELRTELRQFADLEAKLAESEENFIVANNLRKNSDEVLLNYKTEKYGLDKTIQELRKIKLSLPEKEWYYKGFENCERQMSSHIADLTLEVKELRQQLAEKEKENTQLKTTNDRLYKKNKKLENQIVESNIRFYKKGSIEQLEKVKSEIPFLAGLTQGKTFFVNSNQLKIYIDNQIEQLKKEMK